MTVHDSAPDTGGDHDHTPEEERRIREAALDETIGGTFPASDPPSSIPNPDQHDAAVTERTELTERTEKTGSHGETKTLRNAE